MLCIPMKFSGAKYAERPFNQERFLKYIIHQPISIYLLNEPNADGSSLPEGDVLTRSIFSRRSHPGYSLEQVYKMNAVANSTSSGVEMRNSEPLENGSQSYANPGTDENQDANHV
ncbi:unnamed protein product [Orchesella dallaii]|uniref:Uncharacterized protein n=1 Tax=Orchesella dallaii TaxID=48710 RepID=A0ABP1QJH3_9HEXA